MRCVKCRGKCKKTRITDSFSERGYVLVRNLPSHTCKACGQVHVDELYSYASALVSVWMNGDGTLGSC